MLSTLICRTRTVGALLLLTLGGMNLAHAYTPGDTPALARAMVGPHRCTAILQKDAADSALVVCMFPQTASKRYNAQGMWIREHFSMMKGTPGLYTSDAGMTAQGD